MFVCAREGKKRHEKIIGNSLSSMKMALDQAQQPTTWSKHIVNCKYEIEIDYCFFFYYYFMVWWLTIKHDTNHNKNMIANNAWL